MLLESILNYNLSFPVCKCGQCNVLSKDPIKKWVNVCQSTFFGMYGVIIIINIENGHFCNLDLEINLNENWLPHSLWNPMIELLPFFSFISGTLGTTGGGKSTSESASSGTTSSSNKLGEITKYNKNSQNLSGVDTLFVWIVILLLNLHVSHIY